MSRRLAEFTDSERILQVLIHDLRTPLGVAQGYIRLLQDRRLESPEERDRALSETMKALGNLSRLCQEASGFLDREPAVVSMAAPDLAARVGDRLRGRGALVNETSIPARTCIKATTDADRLADAISLVLGTISGANRDLAPSVHIDTRMSELRFLAMPGRNLPPVTADDTRLPFDPWQARGLSIASACHVIMGAQGQVWSVAPAVLVAFTLETSTL